MEPLGKNDLRKLAGKKLGEKNKSYLMLSIFNFEVDPEKYSSLLNLEPTRIRIKGEEYKIGRLTRIAKTSEWTFEKVYETDEFLGDLFERFTANIVKPRISELQSISTESSIQLGIAHYYLASNNPGIHLSPETNRIIAEAGASVDIDIYCLYDK